MQSKEGEKEGDKKTGAVHIVNHSNPIDAFAISIKLVEENCVAACDILMLNRFKEHALKMSRNRTKNRRQQFFFGFVFSLQ